MNEEELKGRVEAKKKQIEKIQKRIDKWSKGMNDEAKSIAAACEVVYDDPKYREVKQAWSNYNKSHFDDPSVYNPSDYNKGPQFDELMRAYLDMAEQKATLQKYESKLSEKHAFNSAEKIQVIWDFLYNWKEDARKYFLENAQLFNELKKNHEARWEKWWEEHKEKYEKYKYRAALDFEEIYYAPIASLTRSLYTYNGKLDEERLEKILQDDIEKKYKKFVAQIEEKAGVIQDVSGLHIGAKGDINGYVIGSKNKVHVETIGAGGYNMGQIVNVKHGQIFHYRTLVNIIK